MNRITFGQYYPCDSFVHKLDARFKILAVILFMVIVFMIKDFSGYAVMGVYLVTVILISRIKLSTVLNSVRAVLFLIIFATVLNIFFYRNGETVLFSYRFLVVTKEGVLYSAKMVLRLVMLVIGSSILTLTTNPTDITNGLESLLSPLKLLHIPVHDFALTTSIALRFIPTLMEETDKIMKAQKSRGAGYDEGNFMARIRALVPVLIPLIVSAFRRAEELGNALDARCYNASPHRTRYRLLQFSWRDGVATAVTLLVMGFILFDRYYFGGLF